MFRRRSVYMLFVALAALSFWPGERIRAAEISCISHPGDGSSDASMASAAPIGVCIRGLISGPIVEGDADKFKAFVRKNHPWRTAKSLVHALGRTWLRLAQRSIRGAAIFLVAIGATEDIEQQYVLHRSVANDPNRTFPDESFLS